MTWQEWDKLKAEFLFESGFNQAGSTMLNQVFHLKVLSDWFKMRGIDPDFTLENLHEFFRSQVAEGKAIGTLWNRHNLLRVFGRWMTGRGLLAMNFLEHYNPLRCIGPANKPTRQSLAYTKAEVDGFRRLVKGKGRDQRYVAALDAMMIMGWETGMRISDMLALQWGNVYWDERTIRYIPRKTRRFGREVVFPMTADLESDLRETHIRAGQPIKGTVFKFATPATARRLRLKGWRGWHALRRGFVTRMALSGASPLEISHCTGQSLATLGKYFAPSLEVRREILENAKTFYAGK